MRAKFNEGGYQERLRNGDLREVPLIDRHLRPNEIPDFPFCTRSLLVRYVNRQDRKVAMVHYYRLPDGRIGGSGLPDPKAIWTTDCHYYPLDRRKRRKKRQAE